MDKKEYYTNCCVKFGKILYRGYSIDEAGVKRRTHGRIPYKPTMYVETQDEDSEFKSLFGKPLQEKQFDSIAIAREYVKSYSGVMNIYGYAPNRFEYAFLAQNFPDILEVGIDDISVGTIDIETTVENGRMDTINVPEEIILITYQNLKTKKLVTWGSRPSTADDYVLCLDESDLLRKFIRYIQEDDPDVITGWNCKKFDIPYIINKSNKLLGEEETNKLSPFGMIEMKEEEIMGKMTQIYTIVGRSILDLLDLYLKFTFIKRDNNRLDTIARVELGAGKLENPYSTFKEFYQNDWNLFVSYNKVDVIRVSELEDKLGLISLVMAISYLTKINYADTFSPVKTWECFILSELLNENTFVSIKQMDHEGGTIEGGYVSKPVPGTYDWLVSIDCGSMYPSIIRGLNISPETLVGMDREVSIDKYLGGLSFDGGEYAVGANGAMFSKEKDGIIPRLITKVLDGRSIAKKEMIKAKQKKELILAEMRKRGLE